MKDLFWVASSLKDLKALPPAVVDLFGYALHQAQIGEKNDFAKPLKGFGGAGVLEVVSAYDGDAFRAVYTVRFADAVYVLHVFQKKAKSGARTPKAEMDLVRRRLKAVEDTLRTRK